MYYIAYFTFKGSMATRTGFLFVLTHRPMFVSIKNRSLRWKKTDAEMNWSFQGKTDFIPAFHPKARWCYISQVAGLLACSLFSNLPIDKAFGHHQQWYGVSTVVNRQSAINWGRRNVANQFSKFASHSPLTIYHSRNELTATGIAPELHRFPFSPILWWLSRNRMETICATKIGGVVIRPI